MVTNGHRCTTTNRIVFGTAAVLTSVCGLPAAIGQVAERVGENVVQYHVDAEARTNRLPSLMMVEPLRSLGRAPQGFSVVPEFSTDDQGRQVTRIEIEPGTSLYGNGQVSGPLLRNGRVTETWNLDAYGYQDDAKNLYTSHPFVLAVRPDGSAYGVIADTSYRSELDLTEDIVFRSHGREHPVVIIERDHPEDVVAELGRLTGTIEMPPRWAIGYHQCRYSYNPDSRVREVAMGFRERQIPADIIWMDIDYMHDFRTFSFDPEQFPDPKSLNDFLGSIGFSNIWMINPGVKNEEGYWVHDQGDARDVWTKKADGTEFHGDVWPGQCVFPDFMNGEVRAW